MNKNNPFKVGDYAKCIEKPGDEFRITIGKIYKVFAIPSWVTDIKINTDGGPNDWQYIRAFRFEKVNNPNEIKQMNKKIIYNVRLFEDSKFTKAGQTTSDDIAKATETYTLCHSKDNPRNRVYGLFMVNDGVETLIAQSEEPVKAPVVNGYQMEYKKDAQCAKFGCALIDATLLINLRTVMNSKNYKGNRHVKTIYLDSNVAMSAEEVENAVKYIENIQNKK